MGWNTVDGGVDGGCKLELTWVTTYEHHHTTTLRTSRISTYIPNFNTATSTLILSSSKINRVKLGYKLVD